MEKLRVGVLGATGMVGQKYISLLENHPLFEVSYVAASPRSAGKTYAAAVRGRWHFPGDIPRDVRSLEVRDANKVSEARRYCDLVFSALEMGKDEIIDLENKYAEAEIAVVSNCSAHRWTKDIPMLIPEVNPEHLDLIPIQRRNRGLEKGLIVVKPNCSLQSYLTPVYALRQAGHEISDISITTLQAVSGAGYPGPSSYDMIGNIVPYIPGEEEKTEIEPLKILGRLEHEEITNAQINISATCIRVPVVDGHTASVGLRFRRKPPSIENITEIWQEFQGEPQKLKLPMAPEQPIIYTGDPYRPQPRFDCDNDKAMAVTVGRLRKCGVSDVKFIGLSHNLVRGAAGGGILNAELLHAKGYVTLR